MVFMPSPSPAFHIFYDGQCPFCRRETGMLAKLDRKGRLLFHDISEPDFDAARHGLTLEETMRVFCGAFPDGRITRGPETTRAAFRVIGWGWLAAPTGWPVLRPMFDAVYRLYARNRIRMGFWFGRTCEGGTCRRG